MLAEEIAWFTAVSSVIIGVRTSIFLIQKVQTFISGQIYDL